MNEFQEYLAKIEEPDHRKRLEELFGWTMETFPQLKTVIKWNQPMFTDHDTFIIAYSVAKKHISIAPETLTIEVFEEKIKNAGYEHTPNLFKIKWDQDIDLSLLKEMIAFNIKDKLNYTKFWRE